MVERDCRSGVPVPAKNGWSAVQSYHHRVAELMTNPSAVNLIMGKNFLPGTYIVAVAKQVLGVRFKVLAL